MERLEAEEIERERVKAYKLGTNNTFTNTTTFNPNILLSAFRFSVYDRILKKKYKFVFLLLGGKKDAF